MKPLLLVLILMIFAAPVDALIMVQKGNDPTQDHDWPAGALEVANLKTRAGYWEGPPFGGGRYVFEYQCDNKAFQEALDLFAAIKWPELRVIVHDGQNKGFMFDDTKNKNGPGMDWSFAVWTPANFYSLYGGRGSMISAEDPSGNLGKSIEPPTIDVYLGAGHIDWKQISVPPNLKVTDERATAAGYAPADGSVCRGQIYDMMDSKPLAGANVSIEKYDQNKYVVVGAGKTDAAGKFELKQVPPGSYRIVAAAGGHASRMIAYASFAGNTLKEYTVQLAPAARITGIVKDQSGKPVPGAKVRADATVALDGFGYILPDRMEVAADAAGKFEMSGLPAGSLHFYTYAKGFAPLDILTPQAAPQDNIELRVTATGTIKGRVVNAQGKPDPTAQISIYPEGGSKPGTWGAGSNLDANAGFSFDSVPPGRYIVSPFPGREFSKQPDPAAKTVEVKAGQTAQVELIK